MQSILIPTNSEQPSKICPKSSKLLAPAWSTLLNATYTWRACKLISDLWMRCTWRYVSNAFSRDPHWSAAIKFFDLDKMPARTTIGVKELPLGALVEIECVAEVPWNTMLELCHRLKLFVLQLFHPRLWALSLCYLDQKTILMHWKP